MTEIDISILGTNESIINCIDYCTKRGITTEIITNLSGAKGEFVCVIDPTIYYEDYYLHYQYVGLKFKKESNKCKYFTFQNIVVYDQKKKDFYTGEFQFTNIFYRRDSGFNGNTYIEPFIYAGACKHTSLFEVQVIMPHSNDQLLNYVNFFESVV